MIKTIERYLDVPLFISLFSENQNEPIYFVKVTGKGAAQKYFAGSYGHFIVNGERLLKDLFETVKIEAH